MNYFVIYFLITLPMLNLAFLSYDRAIVAGQKNNWPTSSELLKKELIQNPESAQLLYDTGVSSYKNGDYDYALSYFLKASESQQASALLQEQALFNAGNTQVALKQLENALATFQKVLEKNPKNAKAAHNKEVVKKMLEEQKQQQQDPNKDKNKNEQQNKTEQDKQNEQKENNEQNKKEQNKDQQENKDDDQKKNDAQGKDKKEQKQKLDQEKQSQENKQNADLQKKDEQQKTEPQNNSQSSLKEEQPIPEQQLSPNMARMLDEREKKDAQLNKQLMRVMAGAQNAGADHNEHYW